LVSGSHVTPSEKGIPNEKTRREINMKKDLIKILLLILLVSAVYAGVNDPEENAAKPAEKFIPSEKLRADDTVAFPVDI
jgi:hypothetical protein